MTPKLLLATLGIALTTLALNSCSTATPAVSQWRNPAAPSGSFRRVMVGGPSGTATLRRNFEDEFVAQLAALGVNGLPSYRYIPENEAVSETNLQAAAQKAGADGVILMRSIKVEEKTRYPVVGPELSFGIFGSNAAAEGSGIPGASGPYRYNEYTSETVLYDVARNDLVWTGTVTTTEQQNAQTAIASYVQAITKALAAQNLLPQK